MSHANICDSSYNLCLTIVKKKCCNNFGPKPETWPCLPMETEEGKKAEVKNWGAWGEGWKSSPNFQALPTNQLHCLRDQNKTACTVACGNA